MAQHAFFCAFGNCEVREVASKACGDERLPSALSARGQRLERVRVASAQRGWVGQRSIAAFGRSWDARDGPLMVLDGGGHAPFHSTRCEKIEGTSIKSARSGLIGQRSTVAAKPRHDGVSVRAALGRARRFGARAGQRQRSSCVRGSPRAARAACGESPCCGLARLRAAASGSAGRSPRVARGTCSSARRRACRECCGHDRELAVVERVDPSNTVLTHCDAFGREV